MNIIKASCLFRARQSHLETYIYYVILIKHKHIQKHTQTQSYTEPNAAFELIKYAPLAHIIDVYNIYNLGRFFLPGALDFGWRKRMKVIMSAWEQALSERGAEFDAELIRKFGGTVVGWRDVRMIIQAGQDDERQERVNACV